MTTDARLGRRVLRRETHSPRSGVAIVVAVVAILALAWLGTEGVLAALDRPPLGLSPEAMASGIRGLADAPQWTLVLGGIVLAVVGLVLVLAAITPGRRGRHVVAAGTSVAVVDDAVIASALVRVAADSAGLDPDRAVAEVGRRSARVRLTPISGIAIDRSTVETAVQGAAAEYGLTPTLRTRVVIDTRGKVGG